jgi:hypothetical protein
MTRTLRKWNPKNHVYESCKVPDSWNVSCYEADMTTIVNCAQCGDELEFGETYTSRQIHTEIGIGFGVCKACYEKEVRAEREAKS